MRASPSKAAEAIIAILVPPACREEVLGDLHERYRSPSQYAAEALLAVPLVILSRVRRTTDPAILLLQACVLYLAFAGAAWSNDEHFLTQNWGLLRLCVPAGVALLTMVLEDAYARQTPRTARQLSRGPRFGAAMALLFGRNLPVWTLFAGCGMGLLLSSAVRMLFPPGNGKTPRLLR